VGVVEEERLELEVCCWGGGGGVGLEGGGGGIGLFDGGTGGKLGLLLESEEEEEEPEKWLENELASSSDAHDKPPTNSSV